jgi:RHS repeat-associated protein
MRKDSMTSLSSRRAVSVAAALVLSVVVALPVTAIAEERPPGDPTPLSTTKKVPGSPVGVKPTPVDPAWENQLRGTPAVTWPQAGVADVTLPGAPGQAAAKAGALPVALAAAQPGKDGAASPANARVELVAGTAAETAGVAGGLVTIKRADGRTGPSPVELELDYSGFRHAYGGDWANRLRVVSLPVCATTTPERPECRTHTPLPTKHDSVAGKAKARVVTSQDLAVYGLAAAADGGTGDYKATPLAPSAKWQVDNHSGSFSWAYPVKLPDTPGGLKPDLAFTYSSGSVDGRTVSTNNQPSWVGEGWDLWSGHITWNFKSCTNDGVPEPNGDLCWGGDHATIVFNGKATELVHDGDVWRFKDDDGTKVQLLGGADNGDNGGQHWKVTTTDGTEYWFGAVKEAQSTWTMPIFGNNAGEPCNNTAGFADSWCQQAWKWNLDRVVDRRGNTMNYFYTKETNYYGINMAKAKAEYTRAGTMDRVEYGGRTSGSGSAATVVVKFDLADRCQKDADCGKHVKQSYPDTPYDQECLADAATCPLKYSPTFWSTKRLAGITVTAAGKKVDSWALEQSFPITGDTSDPGLWLQKLTHTGWLGSQSGVSEPPVEFRGTPEPNRINTPDDGLLPMQKYRIHTILNESGGRTEVNWWTKDTCTPGSPPTPETNTQRCYPVRWAPPGAEAKNDWFIKYAVGEVATYDLVGGGTPGRTTFDYVGGGAWHYNDDPLIKAEHRSWTEWRGYELVKVTSGKPDTDSGVTLTQQEFRYFRGMNGDRLNRDGGTKPPVKVKDAAGVEYDDLDGLSGFQLEQRTLNGVNGTEVSGEVTEPYREATATQDATTAYVIKPKRTLGRTTVPGGVRRTELVNTYDKNDYYALQTVNDLGDVTKSDDDRCTTRSYARDAGRMILDLPSREVIYGARCGTAPKLPEDSISDIRTYYDNGALGAVPGAGDATKVEKVSGYTGSVPSYVPVTTSKYDLYGRTIEDSDALQQVTKTSYEPNFGLPTRTVVTNPANNKILTDLEPTRGQPVRTEDFNGRVTTMDYDPAGRLAAVWMPGRVKPDTPNIRFTYTIRNNGPSSVRTDRLKANLNEQTEFTLFDGFMRDRQTQTPAWLEDNKIGRVITDVVYDSRGLAVKTNDKYFVDGAASDTLVQPTSGDAAIPSQTRVTYDGAGRAVKSELFSEGRKASADWQTTTDYKGSSTVVTPPKGGTRVESFVDARGQLVEQQQFAPGPVVSTSTKYAFDKRGKIAKLTDAVGNEWIYTYDVRGRKVGVVDPDKGPSTLAYDNMDQLISETDARNKTVVHSYDVLGRKTKTGEQISPTEVKPLAEWTYDTARDLDTGALIKGQLGSTTRYADGNAYKSEVVTYDVGYRPTERKLVIPAAEKGIAGTYVSKAAYSPEGSLRWESMPKLGSDLGGEEVNYTYDAYGLLNSITNDANSYIGYTRYTEFGELEMLRRGQVNSETWTRYDYGTATRRVSEIAVEHRKATGVQSDLRYGYDEAGNVTKTTTDVAGQKSDIQCFGYDHLRRMTEAWTPTGECGTAGQQLGGAAPYWTSFKYDSIGNRTLETEHGIGVADTVRKSTYPQPKQLRPHAPVSVQTTGPGVAKTETFGYNEIGSTTSRPTAGAGQQTLDWDVEGRVASTTAGTSYIYDADGVRLISRDSKGTTLHLSSGDVRYDKATDKASGSRQYKHSTDKIVGMRTAKGVSWLSQDRNDSDVVAVNASTFAVEHRRLDPFGEVRGTPPANWPSTRGFVGGYTEQATGLTNLGARDYDAATGKFISVDPLLNKGEPEHLNGYSYAYNTPATLSDPTGLNPMQCMGCGGTGGGSSPPATPPAPPTQNDQYQQAKDLFWYSPVAPGAKRVVIQTNVKAPGKNYGIIVTRMFIRNETDFIFNGDNRGFTLDANAPYRAVVAWDTETGEVAVTVSPSSFDVPDTYPEYGQTGTSSRVSADAWDICDTCLNSFVKNWNSGTDADGTTRLTLDTSISDGFVPNRLTHQIQITVGQQKNGGLKTFTGEETRVEGTAYPNIEFIQYRKGEYPRNLGRVSYDSALSATAFSQDWYNEVFENGQPR